MAEENAPADMSRAVRLNAARRTWRLRIIAGIAVLVVALIVAGVLAGRWYADRVSAAPDYMVVIGESVLEDGTKTAGVIAVVKRTEEGFAVKPVDALQKRSVPGTSFDSVREALPMGGPELVARLVASDVDGSEQPAWLFLEQDGWAGVLAASGDVSVAMEESTTAFTGEKLYRFDSGTSSISGDEAAALLLATDSFEDSGKASMMREVLAEALAEAITDEPDAVVAALDDGLGEYSGSRAQLRNFLAP